MEVRRSNQRIRLFAVALFVALALAGSVSLPGGAPGASAAEPNTVAIADDGFAPRVITVEAGATVRWINAGRRPHAVLGVGDASDIRSPQLDPGDQFAHTFRLPGAYSYIDALDPERSGEIRVVGNPDGSVTFAETGYSVGDPFLRYWRTRGLEFGDYNLSFRESLALFGFPISPELRETLEDGREYTVQYFERARFELHPENDAPYDVLLGQFGRRIRPADPPVAALPEHRYFPETGHNVRGAFLEFWEENGGLPVFGYPIGEPVAEELNGAVYTVQYFERARFEWHPEYDPPYRVLLGQFGRRILEGR